MLLMNYQCIITSKKKREIRTFLGISALYNYAWKLKSLCFKQLAPENGQNICGSITANKLTKKQSKVKQ